MTGRRCTCDLCGKIIRVSGLTVHQKTRKCSGTAAVHKLAARGWGIYGIDVRAHNIPGEHAPRGDGSGGWGIWHPAWVGEVVSVLRAAGTFGSQAVWVCARDDAEWREALIVVARLGGVDAIHTMLAEIRKGKGNQS